MPRTVRSVILITVAESRRPRTGYRDKSPIHGPDYSMPTKPGGITPRTQGLRSGFYLWSAGRSGRYQIFPTVFQEKSGCPEPFGLSY